MKQEFEPIGPTWGVVFFALFSIVFGIGAWLIICAYTALRATGQ